MKLKLKAEPITETDANCALLKNHRPGMVLRKSFWSWHRRKVAPSPHQGKNTSWTRAQVQECIQKMPYRSQHPVNRRKCRRTSLVLNQDARLSVIHKKTRILTFVNRDYFSNFGIVDDLSRFHLQVFRSLPPNANRLPTQIPAQMVFSLIPDLWIVDACFMATMLPQSMRFSQ